MILCPREGSTPGVALPMVYGDRGGVAMQYEFNYFCLRMVA